ncbi:hypothetical protein E4T56_gene6718 [Termitomyces sp. T112]|nr:hypothetical protein E4T56_gene6718 [Termitomyces sp. T112]
MARGLPNCDFSRIDRSVAATRWICVGTRVVVRAEEEVRRDRKACFLTQASKYNKFKIELITLFLKIFGYIDSAYGSLAKVYLTASCL